MSSSASEVLDARALTVLVADDALTVNLVDGRTIVVPLAWYPRLLHGKREERDNVKLFADGAYLHWPDLDEDLTVGGLLLGRRSGESANSLKKWLEERRA